MEYLSYYGNTPQNLRSFWKHLCSLPCACCALVFLIDCVNTCIWDYAPFTYWLHFLSPILNNVKQVHSCEITCTGCSYCQNSMTIQISRKSYNQGFMGFILTKKQILFLLQLLHFLPRLLGPKNDSCDVHLHGQNNFLSDSTSEEKWHIVFIWLYQEHTQEETDNYNVLWQG
jgi:hypothetical protein